MVTKVNGVAQSLQGYQDTVDLPPCTKTATDNDNCELGTESLTVVRIPFTNKIIAAEFIDGTEAYDKDTDTSEYDNGKFIGGEFVYHCHLLYHEDHGMMQNLLVLPPLPPSSTPK